MWGLGCRVQGSGYKVQGVGSRVQGVVFGVGCRVKGLGVRGYHRPAQVPAPLRTRHTLEPLA